MVSIRSRTQEEMAEIEANLGSYTNWGKCVIT